jgi:hypothetical protein
MTAIGLPDRLGLGAMTLAAVAGPVGFFAEAPSLGVCIVGLPTAIVGVVIDVVILAATFALAMARPGRLRPVLR